jgi:hypothetical protein
MNHLPLFETKNVIDVHNIFLCRSKMTNEWPSNQDALQTLYILTTTPQNKLVDFLASMNFEMVPKEIGPIIAC